MSGFVFLLLAAVMLGLSSAMTSHELPHFRELSPGFTLSWNYDVDWIVIQVTAPTRGWVGLGIGISHTMAGADLMIGGVRGGVSYVWDCYAPRNGPPDVDPAQNVQIIKGTENGTHTTITLKRALAAGNSLDRSITKEKLILLWAFGQLDSAGQGNIGDYHRGNRGHVDIVLLAEDEDKNVSENDQKTSTTVSIKPTPRPVATDLPYSTILDATKPVHLYWDFTEATITLQMIAPTTGWIGVGFARTSASMNGADIIMMGVRSNNIYALDCHSERNGVPDIDEEQNVEIVAGWENGTHTGVTIRRERLTCNKDDIDIQSGTYKVIWAYGMEDLSDAGPSSSFYHHRNRGGKSLKLINPLAARTNPKVEREFHVDVGPTDFLVPAKSTYYMCKFMKLTEANETAYVTGFTPYFSEGNEKNVHHIIIFLCDSDLDEKELQSNYSCYDELNPYFVGCSKILGGWAVGSTGTRYPADAGFPVGGYRHPQYALIEMHYDNPKRKEFLDSSGLRMSYVREKPVITVGLFDVDHALTTLWIPPDTDHFRTRGFCKEKCLSKALENSGVSEIKVFGVFFHSHVAGRALRLRHYRNGKELQALSKDEYYDFDYQETQYFEEPKILKAGDSLTLECDYVTSGRNNVTSGGLPTTSEMCIAYVLHYPRLDMTLCGSRGKFMEDPSIMIKLAAGLNVSLSRTEAEPLSNKMGTNYWNAMGIFADEALTKVEWDDEKRKFSQNFADNMNHYTSCLNGGNPLVNYFDEFSQPNADDYVEKETMCPSSG